jgi:hypothetical protein
LCLAIDWIILVVYSVFVLGIGIFEAIMLIFGKCLSAIRPRESSADADRTQGER